MPSPRVRANRLRLGLLVAVIVVLVAATARAPRGPPSKASALAAPHRPIRAVHPTAVPATATTTVRPTTTTARATTATAPRPTTTTAIPTTTTSTAGLAGKVVAIDPGHNGGNFLHTAEINRLVPAGGFLKACDTTGTQTGGGYTEAAYNLDVALRLAADLRLRGVTVVMTRTSNDGWGPCIDQRAAVGNQAHASAAISIHADGGPSTGRGFHVIEPALVAGFTDSIVKPSHQLALDVRAGFLAGTGMPYSTYAGSQGLDTRGDLGGLNRSQVPKVFIETGNMRSAADVALLTSPVFRQKAADALASALVAFLMGR